MDNIEELLSQAMVLTFRAGRNIENVDIAIKIENIGQQLSSILKEYRVQPAQGLYNEHKDVSWLTQTK